MSLRILIVFEFPVFAFRFWVSTARVYRIVLKTPTRPRRPSVRPSVQTVRHRRGEYLINIECLTSVYWYVYLYSDGMSIVHVSNAISHWHESFKSIARDNLTKFEYILRPAVQKPAVTRSTVFSTSGSRRPINIL